MQSFENELYKSISSSQGISYNPVEIKYDGGSEHISTKHNVWTLSGWKENEVQFNRNHIIDEIEKLQLEIANDLVNSKNTAPRPTYFEVDDNVITLIGLTQSAKRDTGEVATTLTHNSIGTSSTTASENDSDLVAEDSGGSYARKEYASAGQRKVSSQTAKYGMLWDDGDVSAVPLSIKESGVHWHVSNSASMHARVTFTTFSMSSGDLFVTQINELHQNG